MSSSDATVIMKALKKPSTELMEKIWTLIEHETGVKVYPVLCIIVQGSYMMYTTLGITIA